MIKKMMYLPKDADGVVLDVTACPNASSGSYGRLIVSKWTEDRQGFAYRNIYTINNLAQLEEAIEVVREHASNVHGSPFVVSGDVNEKGGFNLKIYETDKRPTVSY